MMRKIPFGWLGVFAILMTACKTSIVTLPLSFNAQKVPPAPRYDLDENWAALPSRSDAADSLPAGSGQRDSQNSAQADVFFVHPTIFTQKPSDDYLWNAALDNAALNRSTDASTILNQASIFNGTCRVFAPRYRQAHLYAFYTSNMTDRQQSLALAYQDVKAAFEHYLARHNQGRPIVIAAHSQGTVHCVRLLQDFFDGKPLQKQLVVAYLIGRAVHEKDFQHIKPSESAEDIGGFVSWNTFLKGHYPDYHAGYFKGSVSTNPLTWKRTEEYADKSLNKGGVGLGFKMYPELADAQNHDSMLWISKPYLKGRFWLNVKVWHRADMNLFWQNIRENVALRVQRFGETKH
jgi:hypothetical protein